MVDPERPPEPAEPPATDDPASAPSAPGDPAVAPSPPGDPAPEGPRAYALPTARRVVASGLALALASTGELRRASIYIGLLVLGAFGPAIIALLLILGRLGDSAGDAFGALLFGSGLSGPDVQPALQAAMLVVVFDALFGLLLFVSISIDAQVIAISILGGRATERPLRLWEAIIRARQTFWRMAGSGTLVGIVGALVQGLIVAAIDGFSRSPEASAVFGAILATVVVAPLAYVSTSVVLGDVGAIEALSRSWRLFRARRMLAVVVVLFTLVTSAIHLFAFSAGIDLVARAAEILHISVTEGALAFATATVLILAAVVAYGSLTFTIGAVISAPQVTGFLGLTYFSGGLDRARVDGPKPPHGFRYVTRPMLIAFVALGGVVALEIPAINAIAPLPASGLLEMIETTAEAEGDEIFISGSADVVTDPAGDTGSAPGFDLVQAEAAHLEYVPDWLLAKFACGSGDVACAGPPDAPIDGKALLFLHRLAGPVLAEGSPEVAILLALENEVATNGADDDDAFRGASRVFFVTPSDRNVGALRTSGLVLRSQESAARAMWTGTDVWTLVPFSELPHRVLGWDAVVRDPSGRGPGTGDGIRSNVDEPLPFWESAAIYIDDLRATPAS